MCNFGSMSFIAMAVVAAGAPAFAAVTFETGTFGTTAHSKVDAAEVSAYKAAADSIALGTHTNVTEFLPEQMSMWTDEQGKWTQGGMGAAVTVIDGLMAGDVIKITEDWLQRPDASQSFESFYSFTSYIVVGSYSHTSADTVNNWINYGEDRGEGEYRFVKGSAFFETIEGGALHGTQPEPAAIIGVQYQLDRSIEVYAGAVANGTSVASRGYTAAASITDGELIASYSTSPILTIVPEPAAIGVLGLGSMLFLRRRRA